MVGKLLRNLVKSSSPGAAVFRPDAAIVANLPSSSATCLQDRCQFHNFIFIAFSLVTITG